MISHVENHVNRIRISQGRAHYPGTLQKHQPAGPGSPAVDRFTSGEPGAVLLSAARLRALQGVSVDAASGLLASNCSGLVPLWQISTGCEVTSSPLPLADGVVCVRGSDGALYGIKDGARAWKFNPEGELSPPCLSLDGTLYTGSDKGHVYAMKDGREIWRCETGDYHKFCTPSVDPDGTVYIGNCTGHVYAVKNGEVAWKCKTESESFVLYCVSDNGTVYAGGRDKVLHAIRDGKEIWSFEADSTLSKPCVGPDGTVYVGSGHTLHALRDGKEIWKYETGFSFGIADPGPGPDGTVYAGNYEGQVVAVKEGKELWRFETGHEVKSAPLVGPDGTVYVGNRGGTLYAIKDGSLKGSFDTKGYIDFSPAMGADGSLYVEGGRSFHVLKNPGQHVAERLSESASGAGFGLDIEDDFLFADGCKLRINK